MIYSDVINGNLLLPKKTKYTKKDFDKLINTGVEPKKARFICISSAIYYEVAYSDFFNSLKLRNICNII